MACVYSFPYYSIYIDGTEVTTPGSQSNLPTFTVAGIMRYSNFIGRSNWNNDQDADAYFDDLRLNYFIILKN
jgi:hypothetical protein